VFAREGAALCGPRHYCVVLPVQRDILRYAAATAAALCLFLAVPAHATYWVMTCPGKAAKGDATEWHWLANDAAACQAQRGALIAQCAQRLPKNRPDLLEVCRTKRAGWDCARGPAAE
jgi:hypothetical protein